MTDSDQETAEKPVEIAASPPAPTYSTTTMAPGTPAPFATQRLGLGVSIQQGNLAADAIVAKMTDAHLTQVITQAENESARKHQENIEWMRLATAMGVMLLLTIPVICVIFLWYHKAELLQPIIQLVVGFIGGFGIGRVSVRRADADKG
jgi:hypothetical protein